MSFTKIMESRTYKCSPEDITSLERVITNGDLSREKTALFHQLRRIWLKKAVGTEVSFYRCPYKSLTLDFNRPFVVPDSLVYCPGNYYYREGESYINFASTQLGGGVLRRGFVQEEFIFCMSSALPYLARHKWSNERAWATINEREGSIITRMSLIANIHPSLYGRAIDKKYSDDKVKPFDTPITINFVAMPAVKFASPGSASYDKKRIQSMVNRSYSSYCGAFDVHNSLTPGKPFVLNSGMWGCGAYNNDPYVILIVQTIAWALFCETHPSAIVTMNYYTSDKAEAIPELDSYKKITAGKTIEAVLKS